MTRLLPVFSFFISLLLIPLTIKLCRRIGVHDNPGEDVLKIHRQPIPNLGGLGFFLAAAVSWIVLVLFQQGGARIISGILCGGFMVILLGAWDDLKDLNPLTRLVGQSLAALIAVFFGIYLNTFSMGWIAVPLTVFYVLGAINSVNMLDGLDGLAGGVVSLSLVGFSILFALRDYPIEPVAPLILVGALGGFLFFNFSPARVFMGNNGSAFLGFVVAVFGILASSGSHHYVGLIGPIFMIGLPVLDTAVAILRRLKKGKPIYLGDRSHIYDQLVDKGLTVRQTALICYAIQTLLVSSGLWLQLSVSR